MIKNKFVDLLNELRDLTERGKVEWREAADEDCFMTLLKSGGVQIAKLYQEKEDGIPIPYYEVTLLNSKSRPIQTLNTIPPVGANPSLLHDLFELARFNARRGADVLDGLLIEVHGIATH
jgi:hypothetical protein